MQRNTVKIAALFQRRLKSDRNMCSGVLRFARGARHWEVRVMDPDIRGFGAVARKLFSTWSPNGIVTSLGGIQRLAPELFGRRRLPKIVCIDPPPRSPVRISATVDVDDESIAKAAARTLSAHGLTSFGYVGSSSTAEARHSLQRERTFVSQTNACTFSPSDDTPLKELSELPRLAHWLAALPKPCGIMAYCDDRAHQVLDACGIAHLESPEQISIIGVDNDAEVCEMLKPTLSSILPDFDGAGLAAAKLMDAILETGRTPSSRHSRHYGVKTVVERESTRDLCGAGLLVSRARDHIRQNFADVCTVASVADAMGVSRRLLELRFREIVGHTVKAEISSVRLEDAMRLLRKTNRTVADIAAATGFNSAAALSAAFRKNFQQTMSSCREQG